MVQINGKDPRYEAKVLVYLDEPANVLPGSHVMDRGGVRVCECARGAQVTPDSRPRIHLPLCRKQHMQNPEHVLAVRKDEIGVLPQTRDLPGNPGQVRPGRYICRGEGDGGRPRKLVAFASGHEGTGLDQCTGSLQHVKTMLAACKR